jgi:hypothetical protein
VTAPPAPFIPPSLAGKHVLALAMCSAGSIEQGQELVRPLRESTTPAVDIVGPMPYTALQTMFDAGVPHGVQSYWKTEYLPDLSDNIIDRLIDGADRMRSPASALHIHHVEGAVKRVKDDETAFAHRDARYILNIVGVWNDIAESPKHIAWVRDLWQAIHPFSTGATYLNFLDKDEGEDRVKAAYDPQKYERLAALKKKYDPNDFFRLNQNIKPASA